jgi:hypothetical protein
MFLNYDLREIQRKTIKEIRKEADRLGIYIPKGSMRKDKLINYLLKGFTKKPQTIKEIREEAKQKGIYIPKGSKTKKQLMKFINEDVKGRTLTANQIREVAKFYGVPIRKSATTKDDMVDRLINAGVLDKERPFIQLNRKYDLIQIRHKIINSYNARIHDELKAIKPIKDINTGKLSEFINHIPPTIRQKVERLRNFKLSGEKADIEYKQLRDDFGAILYAIRNRLPGITPEEIKIFNIEIAPVMRERMERLKELTA